MNLRKEHRLACASERFWQLTFDPLFDVEHALQANRVKFHQVLHCDTTTDSWKIVSRSTPSAPIPKFVVKWIGAELSFEISLTHQAGSRHAIGFLRPSVMPDRLHIHFDMEVIPESQNNCRRLMNWEVKVDSIGRLIEGFILAEVEQALDASARFINAYEGR